MTDFGRLDGDPADCEHWSNRSLSADDWRNRDQRDRTDRFRSLRTKFTRFPGERRIDLLGWRSTSLCASGSNELRLSSQPWIPMIFVVVCDEIGIFLIRTPVRVPPQTQGMLSLMILICLFSEREMWQVNWWDSSRFLCERWRSFRWSHR